MDVKLKREYLGMKVFVYYNLHKKLFSVKALHGEYKGKVIAHTKKITLMNCEFKVYQKGRERVLKEKRKNVHAGIIGNIIEMELFLKCFQITYDPYKYSTFVYKDNNQAIFESVYVYLEDKEIFI